MNIIRYQDGNNIKVGATTNLQEVYELPYDNVLDFFLKAEEREIFPSSLALEIIKESTPLKKSMNELKVLVPVELSEVWAAGVTYQKSMKARNYEATQGKLDATTFYDKVYNAERPELFFKSTAQRTVGQNDLIYLRSDSNWQIPEPELGLVLNSNSKIIGYTIGNDMSSRDIEGENPLYLPQAKMWKNSCSVGPSIRLAETIQDPYEFQIINRIIRDDQTVFEESAYVHQLKRTLNELVDTLKKDNYVFDGTVLLTGTCIVPPNEFTLQEGDIIEIEIPGIGTLINSVNDII